MPATPTLLPVTPLLWETTQQRELFHAPITPELIAWRVETRSVVVTPEGRTSLPEESAEGISTRDELQEWMQHGQGAPKHAAHRAWLSAEELELLRRHFFTAEELRPLFTRLRTQQPWTELTATGGAWPGRLCVIDYGSHLILDAITNARLPQATELNDIYLGWAESKMDVNGFAAAMTGRVDISWTHRRWGRDELKPGVVPPPEASEWDDGNDSRGRRLCGWWTPSDDAWALVQEAAGLLATTSADGALSLYDRERLMALIDPFGADRFLKPEAQGLTALNALRTRRDAPLGDRAYQRLVEIRHELLALPVPRELPPPPPPLPLPPTPTPILAPKTKPATAKSPSARRSPTR